MGMCGSKRGGLRNSSSLLETLSEHEGGINGMSLSYDQSVLATASEDCTIRLWTTNTPRTECISVLKGHEEYVNCIVFDDNFILSGSADKTVRKWDSYTHECVHVFKGHTSLINRIICTGDFMFTSSYDRTVRCWDFDTGECVRMFIGHTRGIYPIIFIPADDEEVTPESIEYDGNKDILLTGSADFTAKSWSFETGQCLQTFKGHTGAITCMSTDVSGRLLLTGSTDNTIRSWDILTGESLKVFEGHESSILCMVVVNKLMYTGSSDHMVRAWALEFGECTRVFKGHKHSIICMKFHNGMLWTGCGDAIIRAFDAKSGTVKKSLAGHELAINCLQIVENKLFTGSHDGSLRVWDIDEVNPNSIKAEEAGKSGTEKTNGDVTTDGENQTELTDTVIDLEDSDLENTQGQGKSNGNVPK